MRAKNGSQEPKALTGPSSLLRQANALSMCLAKACRARDQAEHVDLISLTRQTARSLSELDFQPAFIAEKSDST